LIGLIGSLKLNQDGFSYLIDLFEIKYLTYALLGTNREFKEYFFNNLVKYYYDINKDDSFDWEKKLNGNKINHEKLKSLSKIKSGYFNTLITLNTRDYLNGKNSEFPNMTIIELLYKINNFKKKLVYAYYLNYKLNFNLQQTGFLKEGLGSEKNKATFEKYFLDDKQKIKIDIYTDEPDDLKIWYEDVSKLLYPSEMTIYSPLKEGESIFKNEIENENDKDLIEEFNLGKISENFQLTIKYDNEIVFKDFKGNIKNIKILYEEGKLPSYKIDICIYQDFDKLKHFIQKYKNEVPLMNFKSPNNYEIELLGFEPKFKDELEMENFESNIESIKENNYFGIPIDFNIIRDKLRKLCSFKIEAIEQFKNYDLYRQNNPYSNPPNKDVILTKAQNQILLNSLRKIAGLDKLELPFLEDPGSKSHESYPKVNWKDFDPLLIFLDNILNTKTLEDKVRISFDNIEQFFKNLQNSDNSSYLSYLPSTFQRFNDKTKLMEAIKKILVKKQKIQVKIQDTITSNKLFLVNLPFRFKVVDSLILSDDELKFVNNLDESKNVNEYFCNLNTLQNKIINDNKDPHIRNRTIESYYCLPDKVEEENSKSVEVNNMDYEEFNKILDANLKGNEKVIDRCISKICNRNKKQENEVLNKEKTNKLDTIFSFLKHGKLPISILLILSFKLNKLPTQAVSKCMKNEGSEENCKCISTFKNVQCEGSRNSVPVYSYCGFDRNKNKEGEIEQKCEPICKKRILKPDSQYNLHLCQPYGYLYCNLFAKDQKNIAKKRSNILFRIAKIIFDDLQIRFHNTHEQEDAPKQRKINVAQYGTIEEKNQIIDESLEKKLNLSSLIVKKDRLNALLNTIESCKTDGSKLIDLTYEFFDILRIIGDFNISINALVNVNDIFYPYISLMDDVSPITIDHKFLEYLKIKKPT